MVAINNFEKVKKLTTGTIVATNRTDRMILKKAEQT